MDRELYEQKAAALKYNKSKDNAPKLEAKGSGYVVQNIIQIAREHDIPIVEDEDLIELLSKVEVEKQIPGNMYKAVAEVFAFIYDITKEKRSSPQTPSA